MSWESRCKYQQKHSKGASLQEEEACPDCPLTKNSLKEVCRGLSDLSTMSHSCTLVPKSIKRLRIQRQEPIISDVGDVAES
jgi:hypothetical protein